MEKIEQGDKPGGQLIAPIKFSLVCSWQPGIRLRRFFSISKNTVFFEKPAFRFYQSPSIEKPKIPKIPKKDEKL